MAARSYAEDVRQVWELFDECGIDPEKDCLAGADAGPIYDAPDPDDDDCLPPFDTSNPDFHCFYYYSIYYGISVIVLHICAAFPESIRITKGVIEKGKMLKV